MTATLDAGSGLIEFGVSGDGTASDITLAQKFFVALESYGKSGPDANKIVGFEHSGDFYLIATGANSGATTDDLAIKLAGVTGVTDISTLLESCGILAGILCGKPTLGYLRLWRAHAGAQAALSLRASNGRAAIERVELLASLIATLIAFARKDNFSRSLLGF